MLNEPKVQRNRKYTENIHTRSVCRNDWSLDFTMKWQKLFTALKLYRIQVTLFSMIFNIRLLMFFCLFVLVWLFFFFFSSSVFMHSAGRYKPPAVFRVLEDLHVRHCQVKHNGNKDLLQHRKQYFLTWCIFIKSLDNYFTASSTIKAEN